MDISTTMMNIGTWTLALASIPQMFSIWKNRHNLKGYSRLGCFALFAGMVSIGIAFYLMKDYVSMAAGILQIFMWFIATLYAKG